MTPAGGLWPQLTYERTRAASFSQAFKAACHAEHQRWRARAGLAAADRRALAHAERSSLQLGLAWPREADEQCAPWHLPARLLDAPVAALPSHPLIDPAWAEERLGLRGGALALIDALAHVDRRAPLWAGLPLQPSTDVPALGVVLHLFYPALWPEIRSALSALPEPAALYLTVPDFAATPALQDIVREWPGPVQVVPLPNRGRDVRPFMHLLHSGLLDRHAWVCKLHTKRSPHMQDGSRWRQASLQGLLAGHVQLASLQNDASAGLLCAAADLVMPEDRARWNRHSDGHLRRFLRHAGWPQQPGGWPFAAGTMFWVRPQALRLLRVPALSRLHAYEAEMAQTDGTFAHAMERLIGLAVQRAGYGVGVLN